MSIAPVVKIFTSIESSDLKCPEVLSMDQILRMISVCAFLALAITLFNLSSVVHAMN